VDLPSFRRFLTADGAVALGVAVSLRPTEATRLSVLVALRKRFPADLAAIALDTVLLRQKAAAKFTHAERLFFTREGLEMASGELVANHRAERFRRFNSVGDFGCGIGADTLALAAVTRVHAVDRDELLTAISTANLRALRMVDRATVHTADLLSDPLPEVPAAFADPGRRSDGKRFLSLADYLPPPTELLRRLPADFPIAFKLAPGVDVAELTAFDGEAEFISAHGELKECVLWLNGLRTARRRAAVLTPDGSHTLATDIEVSLGGPGWCRCWANSCTRPAPTGRCRCCRVTRCRTPRLPPRTGWRRCCRRTRDRWRRSCESGTWGG
jgi:hypothetical protein